MPETTESSGSVSAASGGSAPPGSVPAPHGTAGRPPLFSRLIRLPLRLIPPTAVIPVMTGRLKGNKWVVGSSLHGCWIGTFERDKSALFERHVSPGDVVYDIGANVGWYSLLSSVIVGPAGRVHAFEPLPANLEYLRRHVSMNGIGNIDVFDVAVAEGPGTVTFELGPDRSQGTIMPDERTRGFGSVTVRTASIDDLAREGRLRPPKMVKIDVEGAELMVLRGARRTLEAARPVIFLATHGFRMQKDCAALLGELEYELTSLTGGPVLEFDEFLAKPRK